MDHHATGGRTIGGGPPAGVGRDNPAKDKLIQGFRMTPQKRADLVAFLVSLTDEGVTRDEKVADHGCARAANGPADTIPGNLKC
jgi:cytochrome c peroxidase